MPTDKPDLNNSNTTEQVETVEARQGRAGLHVPTILAVSLFIAVTAGGFVLAVQGDPTAQTVTEVQD